MLKFLTHKLRTHSLNEDPDQDKADDDHDSGTESDDEFQDGAGITDEPSTPIEIPESPGPTDSGLASDTDFRGPGPFGFSTRQVEDELTDDADLREQQKPNLSSSSSSSSSLSRLQAGLKIQEDTSPHHHSSLHYHQKQQLNLTSYDQHSSEEELEVINRPKLISSQGCRPATAPEKRKWSEVSGPPSTRKSQQVQDKLPQQSQAVLSCTDTDSIVASSSAPVSRAGTDPTVSGSSDEEVQGLLGGRRGSGSVICQPVEFRTSPPLDAHKPGRSLSPPPKLFHASSREPRPLPRPRSRPRPHTHLYTHLDHHHHHHHHHHYNHHQRHTAETDLDTLSACSPRKRHRPPHRQPRPCLDFEKMQQLKARAVTAWRHSGEHGNELSVFCW